MKIVKLRNANFCRLFCFHKMVIFTCIVLATLLSCAKTQNTTSSGISPAIISSTRVRAVVGVPVKIISCEAGPTNPLKFCFWERRPPPPNGKRYRITVKDTRKTPFGGTQDSHDSYNCNCTYKYVGKGLEKGDCSISIHNATEFHIAKWECTLVGERGHTWIGSLNITKHVGAPFFKNTNLSEIVYNNETTDVTCCAEAHDPQLPIIINIMLENPQDLPTVLPRQSGIMQADSSVSLKGEEACRRSRYLFRPEDNGKRVICVARFMYDSQEYNQTTFLPVNVKYGPKLTSDRVMQKLTENNSLLISAAFLANPQPNTRWFLESDPASGASFEIRKDHPKYKTDTKPIQGDNYVATLEILDFQPTDYRLVFLLKIVSEFGEQDVHVHLQNPDALTDKGSNWLMILIAASIIASLILIAAVVFVCIKQRINRGKGKYIPAQVKYSKENDDD